jgi:type IV secretory pathway TraG/TraD family ATPase VirD4
MAGSDGGSLIEIPKLFVDNDFEMNKRKYLTDPLVIEFWTKQMAKTSDFHKSEMLNYFMSKFGSFMNNTMMRNIIGQHKSSFNFDDVMNNNKILLVNLSKGKIGEINSQILGLIILSKLQAGILKRANNDINQRTPFYLYVDEFQNFTTDTFISMLSESRKYGLGVHVTNQYLAQLPENIKDAVLGNVGTLLSFEVGAEDAEILSKEFKPMEIDDFMHLPKFNFYIKLMIDGKTSEAFSGMSIPPEIPTHQIVTKDKIITFNRLVYGSPKIFVEKIISKNLK